MISWDVLGYHVRSLDKSRYDSGNEWRGVCDTALTLRVWALGGKEWGNIGKRGERGMDGGGMAGREMEGVGKIGGDYRGL